MLPQGSHPRKSAWSPWLFPCPTLTSLEWGQGGHRRLPVTPGVQGDPSSCLSRTGLVPSRRCHSALLRAVSPWVMSHLVSVSLSVIGPKLVHSSPESGHWEDERLQNTWNAPNSTWPHHAPNKMWIFSQGCFSLLFHLGLSAVQIFLSSLSQGNLISPTPHPDLGKPLHSPTLC